MGEHPQLCSGGESRRRRTASPPSSALFPTCAAIKKSEKLVNSLWRCGRRPPAPKRAAPQGRQRCARTQAPADPQSRAAMQNRSEQHRRGGRAARGGPQRDVEGSGGFSAPTPAGRTVPRERIAAVESESLPGSARGGGACIAPMKVPAAVGSGVQTSAIATMDFLGSIGDWRSSADHHGLGIGEMSRWSRGRHDKGGMAEVDTRMRFTCARHRFCVPKQSITIGAPIRGRVEARGTGMCYLLLAPLRRRQPAGCQLPHLLSLPPRGGSANTSAALVPPKPKLLLSTALGASTGSWHGCPATRLRSNGGSGASRLAVGGASPLRSASKLKMASTAPAAPSR